MEPGRIEFLDEDGSTAAPDRPEDQPEGKSGGRRHGRWPVLALAAVMVAVCGGVLWHQHAGGVKHPSAAPPASAQTVTVDPQHGGWALYGGVRPTGQLLAEAEAEQQRAQQQVQCMTQVQAGLMRMIVAYRSTLGAGGSVREAERAARAALADEPDGGVSGASYDAMFRVWRINRTPLAELSGERLSVDMTALCPA